jgi:putative transposase
MAIPTRTARPGTFFVATATYNRRRLFPVEANALLLIDTVQHYGREGHDKLHAFVVMPDPIHLLQPPEAITLERAIGLIRPKKSEADSPTASPQNFPSGCAA